MTDVKKCAACGKLIYSTRAKAMKRLRMSAYKAGCRSTYKCPEGAGWHLTHYKEGEHPASY